MFNTKPLGNFQSVWIFHPRSFGQPNQTDGKQSACNALAEFPDTWQKEINKTGINKFFLLQEGRLDNVFTCNMDMEGINTMKKRVTDTSPEKERK